jgi:hypothetical protein
MGKINSMEQPLAEIRSENAHISATREAGRVANHHLTVEAPDQRRGLLRHAIWSLLLRGLDQSKYGNDRKKSDTA